MKSRTVRRCRCDERAALEYTAGVNAFTSRNVRRALDHFERAESLGYDPDLCGSYLWQCWMMLGEYENAWLESDRIAARGGPDPNALWDRLPFTGKRVVVRCLHGYGDAIQFARYARLIRRVARRVILQTHPEMVALLSRLRGVDSVVTWTDARVLPGGEWDQQIEVMELPMAFRASIGSIPCEIPYLNVSERALSLSRAHLGQSNKLRVGLLWAASAWNPARSVSLEQLAPLLRAADCAFFSFQRGPQRAELMTIPGHYSLHDTALHSSGIIETAADLMNMDLLITVDSMAAHLAGALGRPVWTMLPWDADWRWMLDREDTPWYPTMRLFRQPSRGEWAPVVNRLAAELSRFCSR